MMRALWLAAAFGLALALAAFFAAQLVVNKAREPRHGPDPEATAPRAAGEAGLADNSQSLDPRRRRGQVSYEVEPGDPSGTEFPSDGKVRIYCTPQSFSLSDEVADKLPEGDFIRDIGIPDPADIEPCALVSDPFGLPPTQAHTKYLHPCYVYERWVTVRNRTPININDVCGVLHTACVAEFCSKGSIEACSDQRDNKSVGPARDRGTDRWEYLLSECGRAGP